MIIPLSSKKFGNPPPPQGAQFLEGPTLPLMSGRQAMLLGGGNLTTSDFDHLNFFQS